jgi:predicted O-methyltransferase YrrM
MSSRTIALSDALADYIVAHGAVEPPALTRLRGRTAALPNAQMQISPEQGQLMRVLCAMLGARRALEIGVFTGYSAAVVAMSLPESGGLIACEISDEHAALAREAWRELGVAGRIDLRIAPALGTLGELLESGHARQFDLAFIDADKANYGEYYELCLRLVRVGGCIAIDNTLWSGRVLDDSDRSADTQAIRALNDRIARDGRVAACIVPIGDGLTLAVRRA